MNQCQKESQRHGFCSKHLSQMREPMHRLVSSMGNFPHAAALPFLTEYYQRRFDYVPSIPFYHPMAQGSSTCLSNLHPIRSYSTPSLSSPLTTRALLVNSNHSSSAFVPLIPMVRQHSVDINSSLISSNRADSSTHHLSEDDDDDNDEEIDIESIPSPSK
jgi:hypothetical protein